MSDFSFPDPVVVDSLPPATRGGRTSKEPAFRAWLAKLEPKKTYELPPTETDPENPTVNLGHPVSRVSALKKIAADDFKVDTRPVEGQSGKRYRIFVTVNDAPKNNAKK